MNAWRLQSNWHDDDADDDKVDAKSFLVSFVYGVIMYVVNNSW